MMISMLSKMNARSFVLSISGVIILVITMLSAYGIWPQVKNYRSLISELTILEGLIKNKSNVTTEIEELSKEIKVVKRRLKGDMANLPEKEMEAYIIGVLQNISWNNDVNLIGVKPSDGNEIHIFQEVLFKVKLSGDYFDLYNWFIELRKDLGFIVIKKMSLSPLDKSDGNLSLFMDLTIASYKSVNR